MQRSHYATYYVIAYTTQKLLLIFIMKLLWGIFSKALGNPSEVYQMDHLHPLETSNFIKQNFYCKSHGDSSSSFIQASSHFVLACSFSYAL